MRSHITTRDRPSALEASWRQEELLMHTLHLRYGVLMVLLALLAACGQTVQQPDPKPDPDPKATIELPEPNPLAVEATRGIGYVTAVIPTTGGTLETVAGDGTTYRLTISPHALLSDTRINMEPLSRLDGAPVTGNAYGVILEAPTSAGVKKLRLYDAATLEIIPASGDAINAIGFAADGVTGEPRSFVDFHLVPPAIIGDADSVTLELFHFSLHGAYIGTAEEPLVINGSTDDFTPEDWEAQSEQSLSELLAKERTAQLEGLEGDPDLAEKVEATLNTYFKRDIEPLLAAIASGCEGMRAHASKVLGWVRATQLTGMSESFTSEAKQVEDAVRAGAEECWEETTEPCYTSYEAMLEVSRLNQLIGGDPADFEPSGKQQCGGSK